MSLLDRYIGLCTSHEAFSISFKFLLLFDDELCLFLGVLQLDTTSYVFSCQCHEPCHCSCAVLMPSPLVNCFRNKFEGTLESLSQFETREAQSLMTEALEAMDTMNNAIILQNEVCNQHVCCLHI